METPILRKPVEDRYSIGHKFWTDHTGDPSYEWAYKTFDGHHPGSDFYMPEGSLVLAAFPGVVVRRDWHTGMGNVLGIRNGNIVAIYGHLTGFTVGLGMVVSAGEKVAESGNTGKATMSGRPHLHFELRDITKPTLKEMVFGPEFGKPIMCWKDAYTYVVNNANTAKTWRLLALRYLGDKERWKEIKKTNHKLGIEKETHTLPDGVEVVIPNYK